MLVGDENRMIKKTARDVRNKLISRYGPGKRSLFVQKSYCDNGTLGCVFFALHGSPPKGYAVYVPAHHYIVYIDAWGRTERRRETIMIGLEDIHDFEVLDVDDWRMNEEYDKKIRLKTALGDDYLEYMG